MAIRRIYAGSNKDSLVELPSPVKLEVSREIIWSADTGRVQEGSDKGKMIGDVVATKRTYDIAWGILDSTDFNKITSNLSAGFFSFAVATTPADAKTDAKNFYRSEIKYDIMNAGTDTFYRDVQVSVIQQ